MDSTQNIPSKKAPDPIPPGQATIIVEAAGVGPILTVRVRRAIKALLRGYGLRCVRCELPGEGAQK